MTEAAYPLRSLDSSDRSTDSPSFRLWKEGPLSLLPKGRGTVRSSAAIVLVSVLVSLMAACGDDAGGPGDSTATSLDGTRTPIPDPGLPEVLLLLTPSGTPEHFDRMCVEFSSERDVMNTDEAARMTSRALELLGIEVVDDGCRAALNVEATGGRRMATYSVGQCWTGWRYNISTVLTIDGTPQASWGVDDDRPPPGTIRVDECTPEGALILQTGSEHTILGPVFTDMWGNPGIFAIEAAHDSYRIPDGLELTDEVLQLAATTLLAEPVTGDFYDELPLWFVLANWTDTSLDPDPRIVALRPLTPYLITLLEREGDALRADSERDGAAYYYISLTLQNITGQGSQDLASPAEWWAWWEGQ